MYFISYVHLNQPYEWLHCEKILNFLVVLTATPCLHSMHGIKKNLKKKTLKKSAQYFVLLFVFSLRKLVKRTLRSLEKHWLGAAQEVTRKRGLVALSDATVSVHWETPVLLCSRASETPVSLEVYLLLILTQSQRWNKDSYLKACVVMVYERLT